MAEGANAYWERKAAEKQSLRAAAAPDAHTGFGADSAYANTPSAPNPSFGFQSGAARGAAEGRGADLAVAATEMGAPTSYGGGAGAPMPVEVVRGARTTFTNPAPSNEGGGYNPNPSQNTREFGSPVQARQAFNRGAGVGKYVPSEEPKLQAAADIVKNVDPTGARAVNLATAADKEAATAKTGLADETTAYRKSFLGDHGVYDKGIPGMPTDENLSRIYQRGAGLVQGGMPAPAAYQAIQPDIHSHYATPENVDKVLAASGQSGNSELRASMLSGTPAVNEKLYPKIRAILGQPKPSLLSNIGSGILKAGSVTADQF